MISLQDQISKFQRLIYNKELAEFVTVDQMFVGGGITMQSLIHQNNFIVQELKKMNAVFKNYCKLNQKVYIKISEHQLNMHTQNSRLQAIVASIDRKLEQTLRRFQELYESTKNQNRKSKDMLEQAIEPLKKQIESKVDSTTFAVQMKKILQQYDQGGLQEKQNQEEQVVQIGQNGEKIVRMKSKQSQGIDSPLKKKGKVGFQQFYKFKAELQKKVTAQQTVISQLNKKNIQHSQTINRCFSQNNKNTTQLNQQSNQLYKLQTTVNQQYLQLTATTNKIILDLNARLNQQVWTSKFQHYHQKQINPIVKKIQQAISVNKSIQNHNFQQTQKKFEEMFKNINQIKSCLDQHQNLIETLRFDHENFKHTTENSQQQIYRNLQKLKTQLSDLRTEMNKNDSALQQKLNKSISNIQQALDSLVVTIEQTVMKGVNKRIHHQLKLIQKQIRQKGQAIKQLCIDLTSVCGEVKNLKSVLSLKANFTDVVSHLQKKADKQDVRQVQYRIQQAKAQAPEPTIERFVDSWPHLNRFNESGISILKVEKKQTNSNKRISSAHKTTKTLAPPTSANNRMTADLDSSTKLFMCGMEGHISEARRLINTQTSRRKSIKSTSAVVHDLP